MRAAEKASVGREGRGEGECLLNIWRKTVLGGADSNCKGPEVGSYPVWFVQGNNKEASVTETSQTVGKGQEISQNGRRALTVLRTMDSAHA